MCNSIRLKGSGKGFFTITPSKIRDTKSVFSSLSNFLISRMINSGLWKIYRLYPIIILMTSITTRLMHKSDLEKLSEIYAKVYDEFDVGERWTKKKSYELLEYWIKRQPDLSFVAEVDGKIVGGFI